MGHSQAGVEADLLASWVTGWALSRGAPAPVPAYGGLRVDVGLPDQRARYVFPNVGPGVQLASREIRDQNVFLKVCATPEDLAAGLDDGWRVRPASFLMVGDVVAKESRLLPGYNFSLKQVAHGSIACIRTARGVIAASGRTSIVGKVAVFDRIETDPDHRRRGLGKAIMAELSAFAERAGARKGVLVATHDGRALYASIGWRIESLYSTAVRDCPRPLH